jgi:hypothetical protein
MLRDMLEEAARLVAIALFIWTIWVWAALLTGAM